MFRILKEQAMLFHERTFAGWRRVMAEGRVRVNREYAEQLRRETPIDRDHEDVHRSDVGPSVPMGEGIQGAHAIGDQGPILVLQPLSLCLGLNALTRGPREPTAPGKTQRAWWNRDGPGSVSHAIRSETLRSGAGPGPSTTGGDPPHGAAGGRTHPGVRRNDSAPSALRRVHPHGDGRSSMTPLGEYRSGRSGRRGTQI